MCITRGPAKLSKTTVYAAETVVNGIVVHVLGYENMAENLSEGGNAMLLPFPSVVPMSAANIIDTRRFPTFMKEYSLTIEKNRQTRSRGFGDSRGLSKGVQVFESGSYTVVLADNASLIPEALQHVPENKRPDATQEFYDALAKLYPNWPFAACCFDGRIKPEPLLWWYAPENPSKLFAPALDAHDGNPPDVSATVDVDHTIVFGSNINPRGFNVDLDADIPEEVRPFLASKVVGQVFEKNTRLQNGDFWFYVSGFSEANPRMIRSAPGA